MEVPEIMGIGLQGQGRQTPLYGQMLEKLAEFRVHCIPGI
jgi:hypothetical protein